MPHLPEGIWWVVAGGLLVTYAISFTVIYCGVTYFMEDTSPW